ncbi:ABC transporter ATP-binding protein [Paenibacillus puerhi]|uniref:ABC transporter ATP-binding protein n=1 Tax=Paenibacillus puerhi TaxID=2692622 RepID=UPI001357F658|nr:ABC transporter ATP-binding protein [Paenibacillus puerhi]
MSFVEIEQVVKRYGGSISIDHLSLTIRQGEIFGLLGPNGAGKSTTINMLCGLLDIDQGSIRVDGISIREQPLEVKKRIGLVPQDLAIYERLTARENVAFFARLYGLRGSLLHERVDEALAFVGLSDRQHERPGAYSGGMKRRLNIACAIAHRPKLIILDEPTVGIDPQSRNHILESVRQLNRMGSTIIYTSHYMEEVAALSTRIGILDKGHLIAHGTQEDLRAQVSQEERLLIQTVHLSEAAMAELRAHPRIRRLVDTAGGLELFVPPGQAPLQDVLFILSKHDVGIQALTRVEPDLEALFLSLTGRTLRD